MTGSPSGGLHNAHAELFVEQSWILCPEHSDPNRLEQVRAFVTALGAQPIVMSAAAHDRAVAICSHLPRLVASAVVSMARDAGASQASGPAFESLARAAGGAETIWSDIFTSNADELAAAAQRLSTTLARIADDLGADPADVSSALELLRAAQDAKSE
jgi:prephenate dehydrogenase